MCEVLANSASTEASFGVFEVLGFGVQGLGFRVWSIWKFHGTQQGLLSPTYNWDNLQKHTSYLGDHN